MRFFEFLPFSYPSSSPLLKYVVCLLVYVVVVVFFQYPLNQASCFYRIRCVCAKVIYGSGAAEDLQEGIGGIAGLKQRRMARSVITRDTERRRL